MSAQKKCYSVTFEECGAEQHPAFSLARIIAGTPRQYFWEEPQAVYQIDFPVGRYGNDTEKNQKAWVADKIRHLKTWGATKIEILVP
jgi:hypothetical protein